MEKEITVEVSHISKVYHQYAREFDRFREAVSPTRKSYHKDFSALQDVDFSVCRGECVGIIGTNGSGKSTLLKIITGVLKQTTGDVKLKGHVSSLLELGAGFNPNYTGIENIYLNGRIMGFTDEEIKKRVPLIESFADIGDFVHQPVKNYSSGMFARLAFAVAINVDPDILIVDEALSVGDIFFQTKCYHKFNEFRRAGKTILFVSHDLGSIIKYCDRCLLLNRGVQVAMGPCKEVVDLYRKILVENYQSERSLNRTDIRESLEQFNTLVEQDGSVVLPKEGCWKDHMVLNPSCQDYGDHSGEIVDFGIVNEAGKLTSMIAKGETFTILYRFRINRFIANPIFAFTLRDLKGTELCGTNTLYEDHSIEAAEPGLCGVVTFRQRMTLQGGTYMLALGLTGFVNGDLVAYHRLYDVCEIQVVADVNTVGVFDLESKVSYQEIRLEDA